jgi:hypothetical protein
MSSIPTARDLHVDTLLTDYAIGYSQDLAKDFVADNVTTVKRVNKQSDKYTVWNKGDFFRSAMLPRADGDVASASGFRKDTDGTYYAEAYALKTALTDRQRANSDVDIEKAKVRYLMQQAKLRRDKFYATNMFATGKWTGNTEQTGVAAGPAANQFVQWNDSSSTPLLDIQEQMLVVQRNCGRMPTMAVTSLDVLYALQRHEDFQDLFKHTTGGLPAAQAIADTIGVKRLMIGNAVENTAAEGQTASMSAVYGKHFVLTYIADTPTDEEPTAVTTFTWSDFDGMTSDGATVRQWYDDDRKSTWFEAEIFFDMKITAQDCGVMMLSAVA